MANISGTRIILSKCKLDDKIEIQKVLVFHGEATETYFPEYRPEYLNEECVFYKIRKAVSICGCNAPVKWFCPHPPRHPRGHHFLGACPCLLITLFFPCPSLYKHSNHSFFQCPALFYHTHFSSDPRPAPGEG